MSYFVFNVSLGTIYRLEIYQVRLCNIPVSLKQLQVVCQGDEGELRIITEPVRDVLFEEGYIVVKKLPYACFANSMRCMCIREVPEPEAKLNRCIPLGGME